MLKVYTNHSYLKKENINRFFPLLDEMVFNASSAVHENYCFVENMEESDVFILPLSIDYLLEKGEKEIVTFFKENAKKINKPLWVFAGGDLGLTLPEKDIYVFKVVDFESTKGDRTIIMPVFINDPYETIYDSEITYLNKTEKPIVGYVGHAKGGLFKYLKLILIYLKYNFDVFRKKVYSNYFELYPSSHIRLRYLKILLDSKDIVCNFIYRNKYRAGAKTLEDRAKTTLEFFENIKESQYTFCMRGGGNFSVRLFETLAMGRIPLQINTDCSLPLNKFIDWEEHCLIVEEKDIKNVASLLLDYHSKWTATDFISLQKSNRIFWEKYLTRANFFTIIHDLFLEKKL